MSEDLECDDWLGRAVAVARRLASAAKGYPRVGALRAALESEGFDSQVIEELERRDVIRLHSAAGFRGDNRTWSIVAGASAALSRARDSGPQMSPRILRGGGPVTIVNVEAGGMATVDSGWKMENVAGTFNGVFGSDNDVENSFRAIQLSSASDEMKSLVVELTRTVAAIRDCLSGEQRDEIAQNLQVFNDEALSPKPNASRLKAAGSAIIGVCRTLAEVGAPVVSAIAAILVLV